MFLFLSKLLPLLVYPLSLACLILGLALILRRTESTQRRTESTQRRRWVPGLLLAALALLWLGGNRWVAYSLVRSLEWQYLPPTGAPQADAIVLLGGSTRSGAYPRPLHEVNEAGDRLIYAAWLYREGRAPLVVVTGGGLSWRGPIVPEAHSMQSLLTFMGVPAAAIEEEPQAQNTHENALLTRQLLEPRGIRRILLVTSALHMPRSVRLFQRQGFDVIAAPADYLVSTGDWASLTYPDLRNQLIQLWPDAEYMFWTTNALKEYIGILVYTLRGWM